MWSINKKIPQNTKTLKLTDFPETEVFQTVKRTEILWLLFVATGFSPWQYMGILTFEYLWFICMQFYIYLRHTVVKSRGLSSLPGFIWPWLWATAEFLCWSQVNVLQSGACSSPADSCKPQFIYISLTNGDIFPFLPFSAQIIGLLHNKPEVF